MPTLGERYRVREPLDVVCVWYWDTVAILDDYRDSADAQLAPGTIFTIASTPAEVDDHVAISLADDLDLRRRVLPKWNRHWWTRMVMGRCVHFTIEVLLTNITTTCDRFT